LFSGLLWRQSAALGDEIHRNAIAATIRDLLFILFSHSAEA
jgi:hypothetical protein